MASGGKGNGSFTRFIHRPHLPLDRGRGNPEGRSLGCRRYSPVAMEGLTHRWTFRTGPERPDARDLVERVLCARGWSDPSEIESFLDPRLTGLHDPSSMANLDHAAERILKAIHLGERIIIYGDYDVDGVTAAAILLRMCRAIRSEANCSIHIPHRMDDGYGLHSASLSDLRENGADLVVSVDCGITATEQAQHAREIGLDLIITDHHLPDTSGDIPDAFCVVHPAIPAGQYPFSELCGAGVAYKLAWRLATLSADGQKVAPAMRETLLDLLALAALGTIADVVPLVDENRIIARHGLARMKNTAVVGLNELIAASDLNSERMSAEKVGFVLGPRLNACGRLGHAAEAAAMLTTSDRSRARSIACRLSELNVRRREMESAIADEANQMAEDQGMISDDCRAIVLSAPGWHPGVIGIVCSRLVERWRRPVVLLNLDGDTASGSCRSIDAFNIHEALHACDSHLLSFGGHAMAAGLRLNAAAVDRFTADFIEHANASLSLDDLRPQLPVDCESALAELTLPTAERLGRLGPFGRDNPEPALLIREVSAPAGARTMGANAKHIQVNIRQGPNELRCVGWGWGRHHRDLPAGARLDVVLRPRINEWRGRRSVEGEILDVAIGHSTAVTLDSTGATPAISRDRSRFPS